LNLYLTTSCLTRLATSKSWPILYLYLSITTVNLYTKKARGFACGASEESKSYQLPVYAENARGFACGASEESKSYQLPVYAEKARGFACGASEESKSYKNQDSVSYTSVR
jgi:uncharacterized lipoprotein YehR (DUF1307 family)